MRDLDIRSAICDHFEGKYGQEARVLHELGINRGSARIDLAVLNGTINGFEIKSERDTLSRLPDQVEHYNKVFDYVTIVLSENHFDKAKKLIPDWWGIKVAYASKGEQIKFKTDREPTKNEKTDLRIIVELLWKNEAFELLDEHGQSKGMKSKNRNELWDKIVEIIPSKEVKSYVLKTLKQREDWR